MSKNKDKELDNTDKRWLRGFILDHLEGSNGVFLRDFAKEFDCEWILSSNQYFEDIPRQTERLIDEIGSEIEKFADIFVETFPTSKNIVYSRLEKYLEEEGYKIEIKTDLVPFVKDGETIQIQILNKTTLKIVKTLITNTGKSQERLPETFGKFEEPMLRDMMLVVLNSVFTGSATGETFSGSGKADIFINFKDFKSLIIECKWWDGQETINDAFEQLFAYNTPNEGDGIIIMFSDRVDYSEVETKAEKYIKNHSSFNNNSIKKNEGWLISKHDHPQDNSKKMNVHTKIFNLHHIDTISKKNPN